MDAVALVGSLAACAVMAGTAALTAWRIDAASQRGGEADDHFWLAFSGAVVIAGAGVVAGALGSAWVALVVGVTSTTTAVAWTWRRHDLRSRRADESAQRAAREDLHRRHDAVLRRWADYDVDPGKAIHYPGMHEPGNPAARPLMRAVRAAGVARDAVTSAPDDEAGLAGYASAVARFEEAFDAAERDLGALEPRHPGRHRATPDRP